MATKDKAEGTTATATATAKSTDIAIPELTPEDYRNIKNWDDIQTLIADKFDGQFIDAAEDLGDGFNVCREKDILIGAPMWILTYQFHTGDMGEFVAIRAVANTTKGMRKLIVVDGSTGLCAQLREHDKLNPGNKTPIRVWNGLRRSDYEVDVLNPKTQEMERTKASTYYLDTSGDE
jgi:hypothetical protein